MNCLEGIDNTGRLRTHATYDTYIGFALNFPRFERSRKSVNSYFIVLFFIINARRLVESE